MFRIGTIVKILIFAGIFLAIGAGFIYFFITQIYYPNFDFEQAFIEKNQLTEPVVLDSGEKILSTRVGVVGNETRIFGKLVEIKEDSIRLQFYDISKEDLSIPIFLNEYADIKLGDGVSVPDNSLGTVVVVKVHFSGNTIIADEIKGSTWKKAQY